MSSNKFNVGDAVIVGPNQNPKNGQERLDEMPWPGKVIYVETREPANGPTRSYGVEPTRDDKFGAREVLEYRLTRAYEPARNEKFGAQEDFHYRITALRYIGPKGP